MRRGSLCCRENRRKDRPDLFQSVPQQNVQKSMKILNMLNHRAKIPANTVQIGRASRTATIWRHQGKTNGRE